MKLEEAHLLEQRLEAELKRKDSQHPALQIYGSTWEAINGYYTALYGHPLFDSPEWLRLEVKHDRKL